MDDIKATFLSSELNNQLTLGSHLQQQGDLAGAVACYQQVLTLDPSSSAAYNNLANLFASLADFDTALVFYTKAVALSPHTAVLHNNLANLYLERKEFSNALKSYSQAIRLQPTVPAFHGNLGNAMRMSGQFAEAERELRIAMRLGGPSADMFVNLGILQFEQERLTEAETSFRSAITLDPLHALAHSNLSHLLLREGKFAEGWKEYEWRWQCSNFPSPKRHFCVPQWRGEDLHGQMLFVHAEQGFGDTIQFLRYIPPLTKRGIKLTLEVHPELRHLTETLSGIDSVISRGGPLPNFEWHCPLMSLSFIFGTQIDTIPAQIPYLSATPDSLKYSVLTPPGSLRVGVVWQSNPNTRLSETRIIPPALFSSLAEVRDVIFSCLQFRPAEEDLRACCLPFAEYLGEQDDFAATAKRLATLDLVITVDTAVAHLAGSLGIPVWILLPKLADWRWLTERTDSPWYPSARLYRQSVQHDWSSVFSRVTSDLEQLGKSKQRHEQPQ